VRAGTTPSMTCRGARARRRRRTWLKVASGLLVAVAAVALALWRTGAGVKAPNRGVFDPATDALCNWLTASGMTDIVRAALYAAGVPISRTALEPGSCDRWAGSWAADRWTGRGSRQEPGEFLTRPDAEFYVHLGPAGADGHGAVLVVCLTDEQIDPGSTGAG
jgi:hypothetical protein